MKEVDTIEQHPYSIKDLESYSGIKAHTIRMWEKRYHLLEPSRSESNIRLYDDQQLLKLLNTVTLLNSGWKISKICALSDEDLLISTQKSLDSVSDSSYEVQISGLNTAMFAFNEKEFEDILDNCYLRLGTYTTMRKIVYPFLQRVGMMWRLQEISPAQEHFAANLIRQKLVSAINVLPSLPEQSDGGFLLFLPHEEYHELGLLFAQYILKKQQRKTYYLGANTPFSSLKVATQRTNPSILLTFIFTRVTKSRLNAYVQRLCSTFEQQEIWIVVNQKIAEEILETPTQCKLITQFEEFEELIIKS